MMKRRAEKKTIKPKAPSLPSPSSILDEPISKPIYVVQHYLFGSIMCILRLETPLNNLMNRDPARMTFRRIEKRRLDFNDCAGYMHFHEYLPRANMLNWLYSPPTSPNSFMYILPTHPNVQLPGFMFDNNTRLVHVIPSLPHPTSGGHVVSCRGQAYYLALADSDYPRSHHTFECYNPDEGNWKRLEPFPDHFDRSIGFIKATAVCDDTILYNMDQAFRFWAYNLVKDKWYLVEVIDDSAEHDCLNWCYTIFGLTVVLEKTIYALTTRDHNAILEICIEKKEIDDDFTYKCTLVKKNILPGLKPVDYDKEGTYVWSRHLAYLGDNYFCLVQSCCTFMFEVFQPLQLTSIKLVKNEMGVESMTVTGTCLYEVLYEKHGPCDTFDTVLCFSLPEYKCLKPVPVSTRGGADEGHYIYVRNLPHEVTKEQLVKKLKKFGPIKRDGIWVNKNVSGKCYAYVEFESATSKTRAVEASPIKIGGSEVVVQR